MTFAELHRTVLATLAGKRLGTPVFVRCTLQGSDKPDAIPAKLARLTTAVREWVGQPPDRVYAVGKPEDGQVTLSLVFRNGATAQLSYARGERHGDGIDLMVFGNRGAMYHDAGAGNLWDEPAALDGEGADAATRAAVEWALRSGKPEPFEAGAKP